MSKKNILIQNNENYKRIALINSSGELVEYSEKYTDINESKHSNIYYGTIVSIEPQLNAVFVAYGEDKYGFLNFTSISPEYLNIPNKDKILDSLRNSFGDNLKNSDLYKNLPIEKAVHIGQKLIIQVIRDEKENKGVMLSTFISIQGKFIKIIFNSINNNIICNNKIIKKEIENYCKINELKGSIICFKEEDWNRILEDLNYFNKIWNKIKNHNYAEKNLIYSMNDIFLNFFIFNLKGNLDDINKIFLEGNPIDKVFNNIPIIYKENIFNNIEKQIEKIFNNIVQLPNGGYLIIESTAIGTTIDVNMGKNKNIGNYREIILETNLEAIAMICNQVRLRNLGGLVIVDLIDMESIEDIIKVQNFFEKNIENDFVKINFDKINSFNMLLFSRQYKFLNLVENRNNKCKYCDGSGKSKKIEIICIEILQKIQYIKNDCNSIEISTSKDIILHMMNNYKKELLESKIEIMFLESEFSNSFEIFKK